MMENVDNPDLAVQCALLHDVVEDTDIPLDVIEAKFGREVASGVSALSKDNALPKLESMKGSLSRIRKEPREVWMVKLADRISNLMPPPPHWDAERCKTYQTEARLILETLASASHLLADRLAAKIKAYDQYTK
jgi:(p)ppGpp synthase/HD superfamily hydrolase